MQNRELPKAAFTKEGLLKVTTDKERYAALYNFARLLVSAKAATEAVRKDAQRLIERTTYTVRVTWTFTKREQGERTEDVVITTCRPVRLLSHVEDDAVNRLMKKYSCYEDNPVDFIRAEVIKIK